MSYGATASERETTPLLPQDADDRAVVDKDGRGGPWRAWLDEELGPPDMVVSNLIITLSTSMLDVVMYQLYQTFATNQTGNTVFLSLAVLYRGHRKLRLAFASLAGWLGGAFVFGQLGARVGHRKRGWVLSTMTFQTLTLLVFCFLISPLASVEFNYQGRLEWVAMLLSAIQGGSQFIMCTHVGVPEINASTATAAYGGLISDPTLFKLRGEAPRDRRLTYLVVFWVGCFLGLALEQQCGALVASLTSAGIKVGALAFITRARASETHAVSGLVN